MKLLTQDNSSLTSASKFIKKYLIFLNKHQKSSLSPSKETKKELIEVYNNLLASALSPSNIKHIKIVKNGTQQ